MGQGRKLEEMTAPSRSQTTGPPPGFRWKAKSLPPQKNRDTALQPLPIQPRTA